MAIVASSQQTLSANAFGNWFTPANSGFVVDVDGDALVQVQTTRASGDTDAKALFVSGTDQTRALLKGPCTYYVQGVAGRRYRFWVVSAASGSVAVAADE